MRSTGSDKPTRRCDAARPDCGVLDTDRFQVHPLTGRDTTEQPDFFDVRVERAWRFMQPMVFLREEHRQVRRERAEDTASEFSHRGPSQELSS